MKSISSLFTRMAFFFIFGLMAIAVFGQTPDFSGKWKINPSKCKLNEQYSMAPKSLVLIQTADVLSIERHGEFQGQEYVTNSKLNLDGSESVNVGMMETKIKSFAVWSEDKTTLTVKTSVPMENAGEISISEVYKRSGSDLTIETSSKSDWGESTETYVFEKE
jgi:recombinational DNA repair protein RecR